MTLFLKANGSGKGQAYPVAMRCPRCRRDATFEPIQEFADLIVENNTLWAGHRRCPNPECQTHVFIVTKPGNRSGPVAAYPAERIDFDASSIPQRVTRAFDEAITCHAAGCYVAAAMLVRKTFEELCDERGATGKDLKSRIQTLRGKVILPDALFDAMDALRLLGNDAAHIEAKSYDNVGEPEVAAGIALTKEILKAVYQYSSLLGQLNSLRAVPPAV